MKKVLIITTVSGFVPQFEMNNVRILQSLGYEVHYGTNYNMPVYGEDNLRLNNTGIIRHQIDFVRSPYRIIKNIKAYKQIIKLMKAEKFDLVHCHTPMGGVLGRLAAKATKIPSIIYTAHGFHFFKGAPIINWLIYYPIERHLSKYTDLLITINKEDYKIAKKFKFRHDGKVVYIKGVGINTEIRYNDNVNRLIINQEYGIHNSSFIITSVGELSKRKNHRVILEAIAKLGNRDIKYLICGTGSLENELKRLAYQLNIEEQVIFTGYIKDIHKILSISDGFIFPSLQEGLSVALLEAMSAGLPVICSKIRGNVDLIDDRKGGYLVHPTDVDGFVQALDNLVKNHKSCRQLGLYNKRKVKNFDIKEVSKNMTNIYMNIDKQGI